MISTRDISNTPGGNFAARAFFGTMGLSSVDAGGCDSAASAVCAASGIFSLPEQAARIALVSASISFLLADIATPGTPDRNEVPLC